MPRYEYVEGTSNKFWEIELAGGKYSCKWGKIGGSVSMNSKDCGDAAAAKKAYDKLIAEKEKKGYQLVGGTAAKANGKAAAKKPAKQAAPAGPARNPELEKAIRANPDDPDAYLVYADWLQGQGEIRGELIVLQHAGKTKEANALIRKFSDWFLGPFAKKKPETFELEWQYGFIKSAKIGWPDFHYGAGDDEDDEDDDDDGWGDKCKKLLIAFLGHPSAQFIQELQLGCVPGDEEMNSSYLAEAIDEVEPPCLRVLEFNDTGNWDISSTSAALPDSKSIKGVRRLVIRGGNITIGKLDLPELRDFRVESGGLTSRDLKQIANAKWPKIEKLEIWCGDPHYGGNGTAKDLAPIFAATGLPKLKHLGIRNCAFADEAIDKLIKSKILRQLEVLDLSMGNASDRGVDKIVAHKDAFAHLALLDLDDNALTEISKPKLKGIAKKTNYGRQGSPERAVPRADDDRWARYVAVGE